MRKHLKNNCMFITLVSILLLSACSPSQEDIKKNISLNVVEDTISSTGITLIFKNSSMKSYIYGEDFKLMQEISGQWENVPMITDEAYVILIAYRIPPISQKNEIIDWEDWYGYLDSGTYRIEFVVTSYDDSDINDIVTAEFKISE